MIDYPITWCLSLQTSLLATKLFFPPPRSDLVPRARLVERLQAGLRGPLTLISAPAGSGKTTLLSQWRMGPGAGLPVAWLSLDPDDNDPGRFLDYLSAALELLRPGLAEEIRPLLQSGENPNWEAVLTILINRLSSLSGLESESVLALDDYHLIENPSIHSALNFLVEHLPPRLHLVLLSRSDPPLPLARLRARGQLIDIRGVDLRFRMEETAQFLNQVMGLALTGEQVAALEKRTEGWIAGLQLAALSMHGREDIQGFVSAFTGSNHYIMDYLVEEVLEHLPDTLRQFLLETSVLERFTGSLCDALTGILDGKTILEDLEHANLFVVPLDDEQNWFRYHHLFADLLRNRLVRSQPERVPQLHGKASAWFEANGFDDEAIDHALKAQDFERAAALLSKDQNLILYQRSINTWGKWLQAFPEEFLRSDPWLCIGKAHSLWTSGKRDDLAVYVSCAGNALASMLASGSITEDDPEYHILLGDTYSFHAVIALQKNQLDTALDFAKKAIQIIPGTARNRVFALGALYTIHRLSGNIRQAVEACEEAIAAARQLNYPSMDMSSTQILAQMLVVQGQLHRSEQVLREGLAYASSRGPSYLLYSDSLHVGLAQTLYEWNALDEMEAESKTAMQLSLLEGMKILVVFALLVQAKLQHVRGDLPGAYATLEQIDRDCPDSTPISHQDTSGSLRRRWEIEQGILTGLEDWLSRVDLKVEPRFGTRRYGELMEACRYLDALGRDEEANQVLEKVKTVTLAEEYIGWSIPVLVLQSVIHKKLNNEVRALDCLQQALRLAEPEGFVRVFLDEGQPLQELLLLLQKRRGGSQYVTSLLTAFDAPPPAGKRPVPGAGILSRREMEVLRLLERGWSDKQIAETLVIARETVHKHLKNIYESLDVHNRAEAVSRAGELGLL